MSGEGDTAPRRAGGRVHPDLASATPDPGATRHGYDLRPKRKATQVADLQGDAVPAVIAPGVSEEANHRQVGGRDSRAEADVGGSSSESGVSGEDSSDDQSERYALWSEASDDWLESRVTTPESSTPSTPRRRTRVEDPVSHRPSDSTMPAPPGTRKDPLSERERAAQGHRQSALSHGASREFREFSDQRLEGSKGHSHRSSPLFESMRRGELETLSAQLIARLRSSMGARKRWRHAATNLAYVGTAQIQEKRSLKGAADTDHELLNLSGLWLPTRAGVKRRAPERRTPTVAVATARTPIPWTNRQASSFSTELRITIMTRLKQDYNATW